MLVAGIVLVLGGAQTIQSSLGIGNRISTHRHDGGGHLGGCVSLSCRIESAIDLLGGDLLGEVVDTLDILGRVGLGEYRV